MKIARAASRRETVHWRAIISVLSDAGKTRTRYGAACARFYDWTRSPGRMLSTSDRASGQRDCRASPVLPAYKRSATCRHGRAVTASCATRRRRVQIIVVDDGRADRTGPSTTSSRAPRPHVRAVHSPVNRGTAAR